MSNPDPSSDAALIDELFCRPQAQFGTFRRDEPPVVVVEGMIARARLERDDDRYELTLYRDIDGFPGELWERSAKTMLRLRTLNHPALPRIVTANYLRGPRVAFTLTEERGRPLHPAEAVSWAAAAPLEAFEQFGLLLDALKRLHGSRTMHRLMLPTAFRVIESADSMEARLSLSRFELSALISNVIRRVVGNDAVEVRSIVRQLYLTPAPGPDPDGLVLARHLAYLAPEIHPYLFDDQHRSRRDWDTTDVFGLGVFGWEMFCGGLPQQLPEELAAVAACEGPGRIRALADLHGAMRNLLRRVPDVPQALRTVLADMMATEPSARSSSFTIATQVEREWDAIRSHWETPVEKPYLAAFMPEESANTLYNERHWIPRNPVDAAGREALRAFYEEELEHAYLVHSLTGAEGYASGPSDLLQEAEWVLIGKRAVWFCAYLRERALGGTIKEVHEDTLVIKYLREHDYARELYTAQPRRRIPAIDLVALRPGQPLGSVRNGRPSWGPLAKSIRRDPLRDHLNEEFLQSLDFLLSYQRAELEARTYPYVAEEDYGGQIVVLRYDAERDDVWRQRSPLFSAYSRDPQRRPALGDFVNGLDSGDGWTQLTLDGRLDRPRFTGESSTVQFVARRDDEAVEVRVPLRAKVPGRGWLRPAADSGSRTHLDRQLRARQALEIQSALVTELRSPRPMGIGRQQWQLDPGQRLYGNAPAVIRDMLSRFPLYALQGPPGSGKTTAVANALKLYLAVERGAKVLVSAQSNYALDNLAERLIKALPDGLIVLREATERAAEDKVSPAVKPYILSALTDRTRKEVERRLDERLVPAKTAPGETPAGERQLTDAERQISIEWRAKVQADQIELSDRLRSGASVVLATCSVAATALDEAAQLTDAFDWVILEEAAKAWPTELIIPLTMGTRWTLIGDHRQLGAYRSDDVERFLESLEGYPNERVRLHYDAREKHLGVLNLFRTLFEQKGEDEDGPDDGKSQSAAAGGKGEGLGRLTMQFRMHRDIAEPVRRVFYQAEPKKYENGLPVSFLESHDSATEDHGVVTPHYLKHRPLVWVDTGDYPRCEDQPMWSNDGEVQLIEKIVSRMHPPPAPPGEDDQDSLAILTPYLAQVTKLESRDFLRNRVHTVHSFQGREADRVIVSLVRTTRVSDNPVQNVGHVGKDEVVNVLLSRAKRLLILVGRFAHFRDDGGPTWQLVTSIVERYGCVVPVSEWADQ